MNSGGCRFIQFLNRINCPGVNEMDPATFDWMFEDEDLRPLMETLCLDITEDNILTPEEIAEYQAVVQDNIIYVPVEEISVHQIPAEASEDLQDLASEVESMEKSIKMLENQKNALSMQKLACAQQIEELEEVHRGQLQTIQKLHTLELPQVIDEMNAAIQDVMSVVEELSTAFQSIPSAKLSAQCFFQEDFKPYIEAEENVLKSVECYLSSSKFHLFLSQPALDLKDYFTQPTSNENESEQLAELNVLRHTLPVSYKDYVAALMEVTRHESQIKFCKDMIAIGNFQIYDAPVQQLSIHIKQAQKQIQQHDAEKKQLLDELPKLIADVTQKQCDFITNLMTKEKVEQYKKYMEVLKKPINVLYSQRARLECLQLAVTTEKNDLAYHLSLVQSLRKQMEAEVEDIQQLNKKEAKEEEFVSNDCLVEGSALHVVNDFFEEDSDYQVFYIKPQDVQNKLKKLELERNNLITESESILKQQLKFIAEMEKSLATLEDHIQGKEHDTQHPSHQVEALIESCKKLACQIQEFDVKLFREIKSYTTKVKLVSQSPILAKARKLFIYALTNQAKFEYCIKALQEHLAPCKDL